MEKISEVKVSELFCLPLYLRNMINLEFPKLNKEEKIKLNLSVSTFKKNKKTLIYKLKHKGKYLKSTTTVNGYFETIITQSNVHE